MVFSTIPDMKLQIKFSKLNDNELMIRIKTIRFSNYFQHLHFSLLLFRQSILTLILFPKSLISFYTSRKWKLYFFSNRLFNPSQPIRKSISNIRANYNNTKKNKGLAQYTESNENQTREKYG